MLGDDALGEALEAAARADGRLGGEVGRGARDEFEGGLAAVFLDEAEEDGVFRDMIETAGQGFGGPRVGVEVRGAGRGHRHAEPRQRERERERERQRERERERDRERQRERRG